MKSILDFFPFLNDDDVRDTITKYREDNSNEVAIKLSRLPASKRNFILNQIKGRQKARLKFPFLFNNDLAIYPSPVSIEQSSSEETARYKAGLFTGNSVCDLTAGFGIDAIYLSEKFGQISLVEKDEVLLEICRYNFNKLNILNARFYNETASDFLKKSNEFYDLIYIDPSRRIQGRKTFLLEDSEPEITELLGLFENRSAHFMIKISPMADLQDLLRKIKSVSEIHIVSVDNECKEILVFISKGKQFDGKITCVELGKRPFRYSFNLNDELNLPVSSAEMGKILYLPSVALTKAGAFKSPVKDFNLRKISANTHIYTSDRITHDFPGRCYHCLKVLPYSKEKLKSYSGENGFNIVIRNFADNSKQIMKKLQIGESGNLYLFVYRNNQNKSEMAIAELIKA